MTEGASPNNALGPCPRHKGLFWTKPPYFASWKYKETEFQETKYKGLSMCFGVLVQESTKQHSDIVQPSDEDDFFF